MQKIGDFTLKKIMLILCCAVTGSFGVLYFVLIILDFFHEKQFVHILFSALMVGLLILSSIVGSSYFVRKDQLKSLKKDNLYQLGVENYFYNYTLFEGRIKYLRRYTNKKVTTQNCICFKVVHSKNESFNDPTIKLVNSKVAEYLDNTMLKNCAYGKRKTVICFHRNNFYIYCFLPMQQCHQMAEDIQKAIYKIVADNEIRIFAQPNFGISEVGQDKSVAEAVDTASIARIYADKHFEDITFYKDELKESTSIDDINEIKRALDRKEFVVYYQPKFHLKSKQFIGSEALIRWLSPRKGLIPPIQFIKKAEIGGLIHEIDMYVFNQVIEDLKDQKTHGERLLPVSINFSLYEFYGPTFIDDIVKTIDEAGLSRKLIEIEITETTTQANLFMSNIILKKLKDAGFKILMDDFGSGYSNLAQLNNLPIDVVKIDKSFIDGIQGSQKNRDIVKFLIALCKSNNFEVIAEGVDGKEEVSILEKANCDAIQGYFYSKPISHRDFMKFLKENKYEKKGDKAK